jgi:hypothetical protein
MAVTVSFADVYGADNVVYTLVAKAIKKRATAAVMKSHAPGWIHMSSLQSSENDLTPRTMAATAIGTLKRIEYVRKIGEGLSFGQQRHPQRTEQALEHPLSMPEQQCPSAAQKRIMFIIYHIERQRIGERIETAWVSRRAAQISTVPTLKACTLCLTPSQGSEQIFKQIAAILIAEWLGVQNFRGQPEMTEVDVKAMGN